MLKVGVLDDYQGVFNQIIDIEKFKGKYEFKIFNQPFSSENEAIVALENLDVLQIAIKYHTHTVNAQSHLTMNDSNLD